MRDESMNDEMP